MKRRIAYVTGTRADFGLMERTLRRLGSDPRFAVSVSVTGLHLSRAHGMTVREVERCGLPIAARIRVGSTGEDGAEMARNIARVLSGLVDTFLRERPDVVLVLGDRGEMLAAALAAVHLNIHLVHIHGGERSGTVDESIRHAISKLAHFHFVATEQAKRRLLRMGERADSIRRTGAPGVDGLRSGPHRSRRDLCADLRLESGRPIVLAIFHPVVQDATSQERSMEIFLEGITSTGAQVVCLQPNSDAGARGIRRAIERQRGAPGMRVVTHFLRPDYLSWLKAADVLVGNSSSGIIEAASLGIRVVNVGDRQFRRERNANVVDVPLRAAAIRRATLAALRAGRGRWTNIYGDGRAAERIVAALATLPLSAPRLKKSNVY